MIPLFVLEMATEQREEYFRLQRKIKRIKQVSKEINIERIKEVAIEIEKERQSDPILL